MSSHWRERVPTYRSDTLALREIDTSDAPSLAQCLLSEEVTRYISPPPRNLIELEQWIDRAKVRRAEGVRVCFAIVPNGREHAVGFIQLWAHETSDDGAVWGLGFVLGREFWGSGVFQEAARAAISISFSALQVNRIEAICLVENRRGNRALEKLGAIQTGVALRIADPDGNVGAFNRWEFRRDAFIASPDETEF